MNHHEIRATSNTAEKWLQEIAAQLAELVEELKKEKPKSAKVVRK